MALKEFLSDFSYNSVAEQLTTIDLHLLLKQKITGWTLSLSPLDLISHHWDPALNLSLCHTEKFWEFEKKKARLQKNRFCSISSLFALQEMHIVYVLSVLSAV